MIRRLRKNTAGTTMVEVLVALVIVSVILLLFMKSMVTAAGLFSRSAQVKANTESFNAAYYKTENIQQRTDAKAGMVLMVDLSKTDVKNKAKAAELSLPDMKLKCYSDPQTGLALYSFDN